MRSRIVLLIVTAGLAGLHGLTALTGKVSSAEEGPMEGVLVSARRAGSTITVTVVSDSKGQYTFPRNRLEPGPYSLRIRAAGYDADDPGPVEIASGKPASADLKLHKTKDLAAQLSNAEWLLSMPGPDEQKGFLLNCVNCHRLDLITRSRHNASAFLQVMQRMGTYANQSTPLEPQKRLAAYLNLDRVIKIIRNEDEPKPLLMRSFKLSEVQADAILNMRLRNLRKLEEMQIRNEDKELRSERNTLKDLLGSEKAQWKRVADEIKDVRTKFGPKTVLGKRRTSFAEAPEHDESAIEEALVEREPITVVVSEKGWIRALRGVVTDFSGITFKADDGLKFVFPAETTSKCLVFATNGRFYTLEAAKLPGGRGHGEPVRLFIDLEQEADLVSVFRYQGARKFLIASAQGRGFVVPEDECVANTRKGKQVLNVSPPDRASAIAMVEGELVAAIGENRKMVIFPLDQVPEMGRGRGVRLQRYKDGGLCDLKTFKAEDGLAWTDAAGRAFSLTLKELADWRGNRADAGRLAPKGFPRSNTFSRVLANGGKRDDK
jgi:hypothetical protein